MNHLFTKNVINPSYFVEKIHFRDSVVRIPRMLDEQGDQSNVGVQRLKRLRPHLVLIRLRLEQPVRDVHAELRAKPEESSDQIVRLQDALKAHLSDEMPEGFRRVPSGARRVVHRDPFLEKILCLFG